LEIAVDQIKALRELTGAGVMDCKKALQQTLGDISKAEETLKANGIAKVEGKAGRETLEGVVEAYIHSGGRVGAMVELSCETDFVSRLPEFKELAHSLTMQIAAMGPPYLDHPDIPEGDPRNPEDICLLHQSFIKDESKTIQDLIKELAARVGENIRVRKFTRFALGD